MSGMSIWFFGIMLRGRCVGDLVVSDLVFLGGVPRVCLSSRKIRLVSGCSGCEIIRGYCEVGFRASGDGAEAGG